MKILGIYGGQDANGLTASLVKEVLAGVQRQPQLSLSI